MSAIPANLYYGPEVPVDALPGAVFNDGTCLYRGGEHGWLYMCHLHTVLNTLDSPLAAYAAEPNNGTIAELNEPFAVYHQGNWLELDKDAAPDLNATVVFKDEDVRAIAADSNRTCLVFMDGSNDAQVAFKVTLYLCHKGEVVGLGDYDYVSADNLPLLQRMMFGNRGGGMVEYMELDITSRFIVNKGHLPEVGDTWIDNEFNEYVYSPTRLWDRIGKLAFVYKGSLASGIDALRHPGPHNTGDTYLVDNFAYVYNKIVNRFVVLQVDPGNDNTPFDLYPDGALEPIPMQGIYRRSTDALPSEPNGCGYVVIEQDGSHVIYNQYGLRIDCDVVETTERTESRTPMVVIGDNALLRLYYEANDMDPCEGDVWVNDKQLMTFFAGEWTLLPVGRLYTERHQPLRDKVQALRELIDSGRFKSVIDKAREQEFERELAEYDAVLKQPQLEQEPKDTSFFAPIKAFFKRLIQ
ncbi:hypothetical protein RAY_24 [Erwinia phage vB_EamM_RAY]|uniref:Uncharacterized protein n=2 Tax=Agricanvirus TaxID=1984776 RepID=A0A173GE72_9CAUD|nr:hypothetical protein FDH98_gp024 [Erwinia phage vB_EamM_RAY]YP_009605809.1 hypothetical protein FDH99_gp025 [Erwinia phage vB_EamM_Simmy50]ANH51487.1 hypothetical protein SIMMY50_25 [Erwinia phage vB_EamM_Simmy50]ANH51805.1 hypothetical protein RAY_24 [Erwinia phage vB_EamM_RAY]